MVITKTITLVLKDRKAALLAFTPAILMASASAYVPMEAGLVMPVFACLIAMVVGGLVILWRQAEMVRHSASAAPLVPRSARIAGQGPAGLLRDLAKAADASESAGQAVAALRVKPALTLVAGSGASSGSFPEPSLLPSIRRLSADETSRIRLVTQAFEADRIELHLQPIVSLPHGRIRFYEALARLRLADGSLLAPVEFMPILECAGRAADFDRRILIRAMAVARHLMARGSEAIIGVNLSAHAVVEPGFLWSLAGLMDSSPEILGRIVLELPQHSWRHLDGDLKAALAALRERGVPFSLDRAADLRFDTKALADLGLRFMKLPAHLMIQAAEQQDGRYAGPEPDVRDFASALRRQGIRLIAERVDQDDMVPVLSDLGVPLAQGFAFAAPRPVKPEITDEQDLPRPFGLEDAPTRLRRAG
ncbi:cyclic-di-GMP phosphodiesterase TipF (flagellum assembly factor) [Microvirga lupini]|uniref:Cyclic-di-GMP phosphodiesterase TipF (Flagellum assembly factor) n=1 Tax=Microvirga lupini TaxID=420324 RepID=A0A7W4YWJ5_9HYPH|nr:EAL domain-containing protein [Microvirga lupini]MBB3019056.1 cyclic-di-GMP phosphodiesterase TipF (flagellum assembly factor) [Microvirga lupini]